MSESWLVAMAANLKGYFTRRAKGLVLLCGIGLFLPLISRALVGLGRVEWFVDLISHWQWLFLIGLIGGVLIAAKSNLRWYLWLVLVPLPWLTASPTAPTSSVDRYDAGAMLVVASVNVHLDNRDISPLAGWLVKENPDVMVLLEVSEAYAEGLAALKNYPYRQLAPRNDPFGMVILSRIPFISARTITEAVDTPRITATFAWQDRPVDLIAWHPMPPISSQDHLSRNSQLLALATQAQTTANPTLIVGDFNATPWSTAFQGVDDLGMRRATGLSPTWPAIAMGWIGIPIDHVLVSKHWRTRFVKRGERIGSDHLPILVGVEIQ